jgi:hypothetical protein
MTQRTAARVAVRTRRDRWADWAVVGLLAVALLLGWAVMALAQGQRTTYTDDATGLTVRYPRDWLLASDEALAFRAVDPGSGGFKTAFEVRVQPIGATGATTSTLTVALNNVSMSRAPNATGYRLFEIGPGREVGGRESMEASYAYVHQGGDVFMQQMPVVVRGLDVAVAQGDKAYVFTLLAAQDVFDQAEREFRRFVASADIQG